MMNGNMSGQKTNDSQTLDEKVQSFLQKHRSDWHNLNVPYRDGQFLHDLIIEHNYTSALEIGTSTGHSGIWIAWALSKTGGKLITIEVDEDRHAQALANFKEAGVADYIDARLADAHQLVNELEGPFDFVFSDADKECYKQYFIEVAPKMTFGGCFTAHNITQRSWSGIREFVDFIQSRSDFKTTIESTRTSGVSVSFKKELKSKE
jgi:caffeoyl-CoA O-methyltransferase